MSGIISQSLPIDNFDDSSERTRSTSPGGSEKVEWETVAQTPGLTPATIIAGRLQAEGIPARAWQEGAGRALGLTVGILGTAKVVVPKEYADQARQILADVGEVDDYEDEEEISPSCENEGGSEQ